MIRIILLTIAAVAISSPVSGAEKKRASTDKGKGKPAAKIVENYSRTITGDLGLERAISIALNQNPDLLRAIKEIERTRGQVIEVRALALPRVVLDSSYNQQDKDLLERRSSSGGSDEFVIDGVTVNQPSSNSFNDFNVGDKNWRIAIEARQLIYSGGQVQAALKIARFTEDQSYYALRDTVDRVIARVRAQFYTVLLNRKLIVVSEENIRLLQDELKDQKNRFEAGTIPRFNVLRAEVAVANAQPDLIRAKNDWLIAQLELAKTLGMSAGAGADSRPSFNVVGELRARERSLNLPRSLALARQRRASLKAQKQIILAEEQQITVAKAGYKPRLEANTGWEMRNSRLTDDLSKEANGWFFGINGTWNIFDGFETKGKVIQAQARLGSAKITYADSILQVELEVQRAHAGVVLAKELIASQGKVVEQADEALRLSRERLAAGAGTQLEVLDAQVALTTARTTQQRALADYNIAVAELDRSTGADTVYDDTFKDPTVAKAKARLRGGADLRDDK